MTRYLEPFRRKALDLIAESKPVKHVAEDLGISQQTIYNWRRQQLIDTSAHPGITSAENAELASAKRRIRELEEEVRILVRARELLKEPHTPKECTRPSQ